METIFYRLHVYKGVLLTTIQDFKPKENQFAQIFGNLDLNKNINLLLNIKIRKKNDIKEKKV